MSTPHQVRRARFNVRLTDSARERSVSEDCQKLFEQQLVPLLETALDNWSANYLVDRQSWSQSPVLQVERLQLDLGDIVLAGEQKFDSDQLLKRIEQQLLWQLQPLVKQRQSPQQWQLHCYLCFLNQGMWPAGSVFHHLDQVESWLVASDAPTRKQVMEFIQAHRFHPRVAQRIGLQHSAHFVQWLAQQLNPAANKLLLPTGSDVMLAQSRRQFIRLWALLLAAGQSAEAEQEIRALLQLLSPGRDAETIRTADDFWSVFTLWLEKRQADMLAEQPEQSSVNGPQAEHPAPAKPGENLVTDGDSLLVEQAGLVLLHPFLADLFARCQWTEQGSFVSQQARFEALFALHMAATGQQQQSESQMLLEKYLVGLPFDTPVPREIALSPQVQGEIEQLLNAVISHWQVLKTTSTEGLQQTFLQRQGSLQRMDEGFRLVVEPRGVDVLLNHLPWGLEVIRLPWLEQPLFVTWGRA